MINHLINSVPLKKDESKVEPVIKKILSKKDQKKPENNKISESKNKKKPNNKVDETFLLYLPPKLDSDMTLKNH